MPLELGPAWVDPGGRFHKGIWRGYPFAPDDTVERYITSSFGAWEQFRIDLGMGPHTGIDIHAQIGTPLYALADGVVEIAGRSGFFPGAGIYVQLQHSDNIQTEYLHLSEVAVMLGDHVKRGQFIGKSGDTSGTISNMAAHLHLTVRQGSEPINPERYLVRELSTPLPEPPSDAPAQLDKDTALEWWVSEYMLNRSSHGGTRSMGPAEFISMDDQGNETWQIEFRRPKRERPS